MSKELATKKETLPVAIMQDMYTDANTGFEGMSTQDVAIPYLMVLQSMSPQVKKGPGRIEGAEEGDLYNSVSQEIFKAEKGIRVIPCTYQKRWVEWIPRNSGGGFVTAHLTDALLSSCKKDPENGRDVLPSGNHLVATAYHYVLILREDGSYERALISMSSTQLAASKRWNSIQMALLMDGPKGKFTPPPFSHSYHAVTAMKQKDQNTWYIWAFGSPKVVEDAAIYAVAKKFAQDVKGGAIEASAPPSEGAPEAPESAHF